MSVCQSSLSLGCIFGITSQTADPPGVLKTNKKVFTIEKIDFTLPNAVNIDIEKNL